MSNGKLKSAVVGLALSCVFVLFFQPQVSAQEIHLNVYGSYVFDDQFDSYYTYDSYYSGKLKGGLQWGLGLEYMLRPEYGVELLYVRQDTHAPTEWAGNGYGVTQSDFDVSMNYIMLGGDRRVNTGQKVEGFFGLMAGMVIINLQNNSEPTVANPGNSKREASATKFAWGIRGGGIIWASPKVGIKIQAQLLSPTQAAGGGFYFGTGGAGAGVSSYSTIYQFSLGGGIVFKLKSQP